LGKNDYICYMINREEIYSYMSDKNYEIELLYDFFVYLNVEIYKLEVISKRSHYIDFKAIYETIKYLGNKYDCYIKDIKVHDYCIEDFFVEDLKIFEGFNSPAQQLNRLTIYFKNAICYCTDNGMVVTTNFMLS